jgi:hypothetical protein
MKKFISIHVMNNGESTLQYINIDNIIRIYENKSKIYIELIGYTTIETIDTNIHVLMDKIHLV